MSLRYLFIPLLLLTAPPATAEIYRWVDAQGRVHYSDKPHEGADEVVIKPAAPTDPEVVERQRHQQQLLKSLGADRREREQALAEQKQALVERRTRCAAVQEKIKEYSNASHLYVEGEDGKPVFYSEQQRAAYMAELEKAKRHWCGG